MNVLFLDFDGVVNTPMWKFSSKNGWMCSFNFPRDNKVNNVQAVQWVSEFCETYNYKIVVTSTWRLFDADVDRCREFLMAASLRPTVEVIDITPNLKGKCRGDEISEWLNSHPNVKNYIILDDDNDMGDHIDRLVLCDVNEGFTLSKFNYAESIHKAFYQ